MKDVPNVCITVNKPSGGIPDRYTICEMEGVWYVAVEHWTSGVTDTSMDYDAVQQPYHEVIYLAGHSDLPSALAGLRETGVVYGASEVVEYAESLIKVIRN